MSWGELEAIAGGGGGFVRLNIDDKRRLVFLRVVKRFDKEWPDGKIDRDWIMFDVLDVDDIDAGVKSLDVAGRRAAPLAALRSELDGKGIDIVDRVVEVECYAVKHPTRAGARLGKWRVADVGPAPAVPTAPAVDAVAPVTPGNGASGADVAIDAMGAATGLDGLKAAFSDGWKSTDDPATRSHLQVVYESRKGILSGAADADGIPF